MKLSIAVGLLWLSGVTFAAAPQVLRTPGYESPVRGDPDDLLMIAGVGFQGSDRVVYQAMELGRSHPSVIPTRSTADVGTAPVIQHDNPPYALTVRLPVEMQQGRAYRLWVVTASHEWSEPVAINDPRPQWVTPSYGYETRPVAGLGRAVRIVGRNLEAVSGIRLNGAASYTLAAHEGAASANYVTTAELPQRVEPGLYSISVKRAGLGWIELPGQKLEVRADPASLSSFSLEGCHPDDGVDDSPCFARAIEAAARAGGGVIRVPPGHWDLTPPRDGFTLPRNVQLSGAGSKVSFILRHGEANHSLLTLTGHNSVTDLSFSDEMRFKSLRESRPVIQLGPMPVSDESRSGGSHLVEDVVIDNNIFRHVGRAITNDAGRPMARIIITRNELGGYSHGIDLPGNPALLWEPFRIDDSVVRGNRFIPGSYVDIAIHQGVMASGMGAAHHVDFSDNVADGTRDEGLQEPDDPPGFRAGFFWNLNGSVELALISGNQIACSGDKAGDGEAISFDGSGNTYGFDGTPTVIASGPDWITVRGKLYPEHAHRPVPATFYNGHWIQIAAGRGVGQTRKITSYTEDGANSTVTFHIAPAWDVVPGGSDSRMDIQRQYWQVAVVGNNIEQRRPPCRKSNLNGPNGGQIVIWTPSADVAIENNRQWDTDGILFMHAYAVSMPACGDCGDRLFFQTGLEIRGNRIEGEYDWSSDCGDAGIRGTFGATNSPRSPPPLEGLGASISHNVIVHSDGLRGGGIDIALNSTPGPPPGDWPIIENLLIFHNELRDIDGAPPHPTCHRGQSERSGIRLEGHNNVRDTVLYDNRCERVSRPLLDSGLRTLKVCATGMPATGTPAAGMPATDAHDRCECR